MGVAALRGVWRALAWLTLVSHAAAGPRYSARIVHTHTGAIRGVIVSPGSLRLEPVEVFLGVPYGRADRLGPPSEVPPWPGTRLADAAPPVCPQAPPDISNKTAALEHMPLGVYNEIKAALPLLANQSEDCLYLNIYVPGSGSLGVDAPYPLVVWLGGASLEWGGAALTDGSVLAARAHVIVVTVNYRLGLLGFLTGPGPARQAGGAAVLDCALALRWVSSAARALGARPGLALVASGPVAALAGALLLRPDMQGIVTSTLLLSGSPLSPLSAPPSPALARARAAQALHCTEEESGDTEEHWLVRCVRARPLAALLGVSPPRARFLAGWAPSPPPAPRPRPALPRVEAALHASPAFLRATLAIVLCTTESYNYFSEEHIRHGFEEEQRNRILRTYVRNVYRYHRNEIFAAVRNEYTDWERPVQHPVNLRDATLEALSDGGGAAPALRLARLHAGRGGATLLAHFQHRARDHILPQRLGSVSSESVPYFLGLPLVGAPGRNYSRADAAVAEHCVTLLARLARNELPSESTPSGAQSGALNSGTNSAPVWPLYRLSTQQYITIGSKLRVRSHYRGHKTALWLHLVPQLARAARPAQHHRFPQHEHMFAGDVLPELEDEEYDEELEEEEGSGGEESGEVEGEAAEECAGSPSPRPARARPPPEVEDRSDPDLHYHRWLVALCVCVAAGCVLVCVNAALCARLGRRGRRARSRGSSRRERASEMSTGPPPLSPEHVAASPLKSTLKRSGESEGAVRGAGGAGGGAAPPKKRVHIQLQQVQEISV